MAEWLRGRLRFPGALRPTGLPLTSMLLLTVVFWTSGAYAAVGRTVGSFQVSPTGASVYQIPIFTPPGPRGVQPNIALIYNSNGGLGYLGRGWSLSGLSSITRCTPTVAQDAYASAVSVNTHDPYCLDGNRLRYQGGGSYGTSGSTWATEFADFSQITGSGTAGLGVESWTVNRKDGLTYTYGGTSNSRVMAKPLGYSTANTVRVWLVSEIADRYGNKIKFTYKTPDTTTSGTSHPIKIEWTQTSWGSGSYVYSMDFTYAAGGNAPASSFSAYVAANSIKETDLLTSISVSVSGTVVRKYFLTYESSPSTVAKRLIEVKECSDSSGTDCLAETEIAYQDGVVGYNTGSPVLTQASSEFDGRYDFNGDGIKDIAYKQAGTWRVRLGTVGSGYGSEVDTGQAKLRAGKLLGNHADQLLGLSGGTWYVYEWSGSSFAGTSTGITSGASSADIVVADVNGDGRSDLMYMTGLGTGTWIYSPYDIYPTMGTAVRLNTYSGSGPSFASPVTNTTVLFGVLPIGAVGMSVPYGAWMTSSANWVELSKGGDVNGDRKEEINAHVEFNWCLAFGEWTWWDGYYWAPGPGPCGGGYVTSFLEPTESLGFWLEGPRDIYGNPIGVLVTEDINDDGCSDFILTDDWWTHAGAAQSNCSGPYGGISLGATYWNDWDLKYRGAADWNGDGLKDPIFYSSSSGNMVVKPLLGTGDLGSATSLGISGDCGYVQATDGSGNGQDDIVCFGAGKVYARNSALRADLAVRFEDGFGVYHSPTYASMVGNHYTPYTNTPYPYADVVGGRMLVTSVESADGIGGSFTTAYSYFGGRESRQGRAFVGFDKVQMVDSRNGSKHIRRFAYEFPFTGMLIEEEFRQSDNTLVSSMVATPAVTTLDSTPYSQRYFPHVSVITRDAYEVGGTRNGDWITRTEVSNTFDSWGNLTASTSTVTDKDNSSDLNGQSWTTSTSTSFSPSTTYWCLGLPTASSTTSSTTVTGESPVTISKSFTPNYLSCHISAEVVEPSNYPRRVDTAYSYDWFGNLYSVAVTGYNPNSSAMTTRTSTTTWGSANGTTGGTGQFLVAEQNALGQTTTRTFHATFGSLVTETDPNGIVVASNEYDTFGRLARNIRPDGTATRMTYAACATYSCENGDPGSGATGINKMIVVASERDAGDNQIRDSRTHLDQFDRTIVQKTMTLAGGYSRSGTQYDAYGRVERQTAPCNATSCTVYWVENTYDLLGRIVSQSRPRSQSLSTPVATTFVYAGRRQEIIDPQSKKTIKVLDVNGWMRRSEDHDGYAQLFGYDAAGSLKSVTDTAYNTLFEATYVYGITAFQTTTSDMDLGDWSYTYNSLGELTGWTDAKNQSFSQTYDALSRVTSRTDPEGTATWTWGTSSGSKNIGRLAGVSMTGYSESFSYDSVGRPSTRTITTDQSYAIDYAYNSQGSLDTLTYPTNPSLTRVKVKYGYANGILNSVTDWTSGSAGTVYWTANAKNVRGQTTQETLGNGVETHRMFDAVTGWLSTIKSGLSGGTGLQHLGYQYDLVGNVIQRQENSPLNLTEDFYYDNLYRLDYSTLNSVTNLNLTYDAMGNITNRTDVNGNATWTYHGTKKHAVTSTGSGGVTFGYDANGNMTSRAGSSITWSSFNYPTAVTTATESATFYYGPDRQYYRQVYTGPASPTGSEETHYVGGILEKVDDGLVTDWRHYIHAEGQVVAIVSRPSSGSPAVYYPLEDNQGSGSSLSDGSGTLIARQSYTAFGLPRDGTDWDGAVPGGDQAAINAITRRGYTGHSMLGSMGLIHMNGRVQDAVLGRFLSPDPTVPTPGFTQMFNRYSYVNNNPLSYADPSGFEPSALDDLNYLMRRYEDIAHIRGAMCGAVSELCASFDAELQYYEMMYQGMLAQQQASRFGEYVMAEFSRYDSSPGVTHVTVQVQVQRNEAAVTGQASSSSNDSAGTTEKPGTGRFVNMGKYTTDPEIVKWTVAFLNSIPQHNNHLENTFSLRINKAGHLTFTDPVTDGVWDPVTGVVESTIRYHPDALGIAHDHGRGQSDPGIGPRDRFATESRGLVSFIQTTGLDVHMVEPTRRNRSGTYGSRAFLVWRAE